MPQLTREEKERIAEVRRTFPAYNGLQVAEYLHMEADERFWRAYVETDVVVSGHFAVQMTYAGDVPPNYLK